MESHMEDLEAVVARSNLVATAVEFVPQSQARPGQFDRMYMPHRSSDRDLRFRNNVGSNGGCHGSSEAHNNSESNLNESLDQPHSSNYQPNNHFKNDSQRANNLYYSRNREPKYSKNQSKSDDRWRRVDKEFINSNLGLKNRATEKVSVVSPGRSDFHYDGEHQGGEANPQENPYYSGKPKYKQRNFDRHNYRSYERNNTAYFKNQHWNNNSSSSERDSYQQLEEYQAYSGARSRNRQSSEENYTGDDDSVNRKRNGSHRDNNKSKQTSTRGYQEQHKSGDNSKTVGKQRGEGDAQATNEKVSKNSQREHLIDLLTRGVLECLVCCEHVHQSQNTWSCSNCYHVLHLKCIIKWAKSSKSDFGWRCPACQNVTGTVPYEYLCFCSKVREPEWNRSDCPHSCGEVCGKTRRESCPHKCVLLCHPGPCPQCTATVSKSCGCGKTSTSVQCFASDAVVCSSTCGKLLNCQLHECKKTCHMEGCEECKETIQQVCFCGKETRQVACTTESTGVETFCCGAVCGKQLSCGNHFCNRICHEGDCSKCDLQPEFVKFCPCGKSELTSVSSEERKSCKDPIPTCELKCSKRLTCGQPANPHTCDNKCHEGSCGPCPLETMVKCRCGHMDKLLPCLELNVRADDARCDKKCAKKRSCGKHKCNQLCCIDIDHDCPLPCNRQLPCGLHRCEQTCHRGHCGQCWRASFEELYCECGSEVIFPPVPCGTRRPPCSRPCSRAHSCEHPPTHNCHSDAQCPPCTVLTKKYCHGRHELRKAVPCHQETFSCGLPCNKEMDCGRHKCILPCHAGPCLKEGQVCVQPCTAPRAVCGHKCGAPCHEGTCPADLPCKETVRVTCECGHRFTTRACHDNAKEYQRITTVQLASKMADLQAGQTIDLNDMVSASKKLSYKTLECNDECRLIERNRRLAIALQIRNPDLSAKLTPRYSDFMRQWAKKDARFCQTVHDKLTELVQQSKQSKLKSQSFSFDSMNREKRQFVHEYCEHFGCESVAYDREPNRNVVATALKDKSWLPSVSLLELIQRESGPRKVPIPVNSKLISASQRTMEVLPVKMVSSHQQEGAEVSTGSPSGQPEPQIDYFDWHS